MTEEEVKIMLENLRKEEIEEVVVHKEHFLLFRSILMEQVDKKHFVGRAKKGGIVIYTYKQTQVEKGE